jgi:hypothetical protein
MSLRTEGTVAGDTPVEVPDSQTLDRYGIAADLKPGQRALVIGNPESAAHAVTGTAAELRLFALRVLAVTMTLPQDGGLLPGSHPAIEINDPHTPVADVIDRLLDEADVAGIFKDWGAISDHGDVAAVEIDDKPFGKYLVTCVPVPRPQ